MLVSRTESVTAQISAVVDLDTVLADIKNGRYKDVVERIRAVPLEQRATKNALKKRLPAFTGGIFSTPDRRKETLKYSQVIVLDIDHIVAPEERNSENPYELNGLRNDIDGYDVWAAQNCYACFRSPSGDGMKVVYVLDREIADLREYRRIWKYIAAQFETAFGMKVDPATKDVTRLCFYSYDPLLYMREGTVVEYLKIAPELETMDDVEPVSIGLRDISQADIFLAIAKAIEVYHYNNFRDLCSAASNLGKDNLSLFYDKLYNENAGRLSRETAEALKNREYYIKSFMAEHNRVPLQHIIQTAEKQNLDLRHYSPIKKPDKKAALFDISGQIESVVEWMNQHYAVFKKGQGVVTIPQLEYKRYYDISGGEPTGTADTNKIQIDKRTDFMAYMANRNIKYLNEAGETCKLNYFNLWWNSPNRRQCDGFICYPTRQTQKNMINVWTGFNVNPSTLDSVVATESKCEPVCQPVLDFIYEVICSKDLNSYEFVLNWMTDMLQNPTPIKPGVALVLRSTGMGTGKGTFVTIMLDLIGPIHSVELDDANSMLGTFNSIIENSLFIALDELYVNDVGSVRKLQSIITESTTTIRRKFVDNYSGDNSVRILVNSNDTHTIKIQVDDRRFYVCDVAEHRKDDIRYWTELRECMSNGGKESLYNYLINRPKVTREMLLTRINRNSATISQARQSFDSYDHWLVSVLERQFIYLETVETTLERRVFCEKTTEMTTRELYNDYRYMNKGERYLYNYETFFRKLEDMALIRNPRREFSGADHSVVTRYDFRAINDIADAYPLHRPFGWENIKDSDFKYHD